MKICLVATFPPSGRQLNEYAFHIAKELNSNPDVELTILGDELTSYDFATDENGQPLKVDPKAELPGFNVIRCWRFGSLSTPCLPQPWCGLRVFTRTLHCITLSNM